MKENQDKIILSIFISGIRRYDPVQWRLKRSEDFLPFFKFLEPLMIDPDREVHQGVGWFLREAWEKQGEPTELFLLRWKDLSPRLIYQYACEKMIKEEKIRFKRTK